MTRYSIEYSAGYYLHGFRSLEAALRAVRNDLGPDAVIGHDGDIIDGGTRTLCWANKEMAENDDGSRAFCAIVKESQQP